MTQGGLAGRLPPILVALLIVGTPASWFAAINVSSSSDEGASSTGYVSASNGLPGPPTSQHSVWFGDINKDGFLDLATAGYSGVLVWAGDGAGNWSLNSTNLPNAYDGGICLGDIDNDGKLDIAAANYNYGSGGIGVWRGNGAGAWTPANAGLPTTNWWTGIHLADMNHDNNLDIAVGNDGGGVRVYAGNGAGGWASVSTNLPTTGKYYAVWFGDVNKDNDVDLAVAGAGLHVWLGNGAGVWTEASNGLPSATDQWNSVTLGDINLDGNLDIVSGMDMGGHGLKAWLGDGTSNWTEASNGLPTTGLYYGVVLADLVGDKYPDIVSAEFNSDGVKLWKGNGGSLWTDASSTLPSGKAIGVDAGDMNNDGYLDIAAVGENFGVRVLKNDATTTPLKVTVREPNGGENWEVSTQRYINWTATGGTAPLTIDIQYSVNGVIGQYVAIATGEANDGTFTWTVPITPSPNCFIRVNVTDSTARKNWDKSNASFSIYLADTAPPSVTNLQPTNLSTTGDTSPTISASYSDPSGISLASVALKLDSVNVTALTTVTAGGVSYTPALPLSQGVHDIYLAVADNYVSHNEAVSAWQFTVDSAPPSISNLQPLNQSTISDNTPFIAANYVDSSGIDISSVILRLNLNDVTGGATVTASGVSYTPSSPLPDGFHNVSLVVKDNSLPQNVAVAAWWFRIDTTVIDTQPPTITNIRPVNHTTTSDSTPIVGADYSDASGISTPSVILKVDSINVTSLAVVTATGVTYIPATPLSEVNHDISLEVRDDSNNHNRAVALWQFTVDSLRPSVTGLQPTNQSTVSDSTPLIAAGYSDQSGIYIASVAVKVDSVDVTTSATVTPAGSSYTPLIPLTEGIHDVYLSVSDNSGPRNVAVVTWWFVVDTLPPTVSGLQPADEATIGGNRPIMGASYSDSSGVSTTSLTLKLDSVNVTALATITASGIAYTPSSPLSEGPHDVFLEVMDSSPAHSRATATWQFTVDTTPPAISNLQPANHSMTNDSTPTIGASFSDSYGIETSSVVLEVDSVNVTASATVTQSGVLFTLAAALQDGTHTVILEVADNATPRNEAVALWTFAIDTRPPTISHAPVKSGIVGTGIEITATVTDIGTIGSVLLHFRKAGTQQFTRVEMIRIGGDDTFTGIIPGAAATTDGIEYYIEVNDTAGNFARKPSDNWRASPYVIAISAPTAEGSSLSVILLAVAVVVVIVVLLAILMMRKKKQVKDET